MSHSGLNYQGSPMINQQMK